MNALHTEFRDENGTPVVWVFASPGRIWKDRWVAFTNGTEFVYFKGSKEEAFKWATEYLEQLNPARSLSIATG